MNTARTLLPDESVWLTFRINFIVKPITITPRTFAFPSTLPDRGGRPLHYQPHNYRHTECVCFSVTLNIAQSIVIHSIPTDETVIAMYYYSLSEIAVLIIKQKTLLLISLLKGEMEEGVYSFQGLNDFVSQPLSKILLLSWLACTFFFKKQVSFTSLTLLLLSDNVWS